MKSKKTKLALFLSIVGMLLIVLCIASQANAVTPPFNDNLDDASGIAGTSGTTTIGTNVEATKETGEPNHAGNPGGHSIWYKWFSPDNFSVTFTTKAAATNFDTLLAVYTGSNVNALTLVTSNDDFGNLNTSRVTFSATAGGVYYIAIDGFNGATGFVQLSHFYNTLNITGTDYCGCLNNIAIFRPSIGSWYVSSTSPVQGQQWGQNGDVPVPADYDGDGKTDYAVFRPSNGGWYIFRSATGTVLSLAWGQSGDKPVPGDYFADGRADVAVFRPSNGTWYIYDPINNVAKYQAFGQSGDKPAQLDYDGDGKIDLAVFRPSNGNWYILNSHDNSFRSQVWGQSGDIPVPGDYGTEFDGKADIAVWRPSNGYWYVLRSLSNTLYFAQWGQSGDIPQPSGYFPPASSLIVYRPGTSTFYGRDADTGSSTFTKQWGAPGDIPATAAYVIQQ